jgi:adenine phosphoribosyltransferase
LGYFDNTKVISDTMLLERAVQQAVNKFAGQRVTKILTPETDGIPLATLLANRLGVPLAIAKKAREIGVGEFIEEVYIPSKSAMMMSFYVPRSMFRKGDCVLIVDDVIGSGETQRALIKIVRKAKAEVAGVYALMSIGVEWKRRIEDVANCPVEVAYEVSQKMRVD